jgi:hypothetical protein
MCDEPDKLQEKRNARAQFLHEFFPKWRTCFCCEMAKQDPNFLGKEDSIIWRKDSDGCAYSADCVADLYFHHYLPKAIRQLMKEPERYNGQNSDRVLDRHKIIALTQQLILEHWPVTYSSEAKFSRQSEPSVYVRVLNVSFAYRFALEFLSAWNNAPDLFTNSLDRTEFAREHYKYLMLDLTGYFPVPLVSQLWFAVEQWGLASVNNS